MENGLTKKEYEVLEKFVLKRAPVIAKEESEVDSSEEEERKR